jgi:hypothetical protein
MHEYIRPERGRGGFEFERWQAARKNQVAQIAKEDSRPGGQIHQKPRDGLGLVDFDGRGGCGHLVYSRCGEWGWDSREDIAGWLKNLRLAASGFIRACAGEDAPTTAAGAAALLSLHCRVTSR